MDAEMAEKRVPWLVGNLVPGMAVRWVAQMAIEKVGWMVSCLAAHWDVATDLRLVASTAVGLVDWRVSWMVENLADQMEPGSDSVKVDLLEALWAAPWDPLKAGCSVSWRAGCLDAAKASPLAVVKAAGLVDCSAIGMAGLTVVQKDTESAVLTVSSLAAVKAAG